MEATSMVRSLQAVYEKGVLRPLEPLSLREHQKVTVTVNDQEEDWTDSAFLQSLEEQADESVTLADVRLALGKIPGSMAEDFQRERDERI
jgi:predicted DNA-binding antitoxin AbrB/MazE fold protein